MTSLLDGIRSVENKTAVSGTILAEEKAPFGKCFLAVKLALTVITSSINLFHFVLETRITRFCFL